MQKKIIAVAIAAAMSAPVAAMADVTVYGKLKASYDVIDADTGAASTDVSQVSSNATSRLGFKGSEDLGGGLSAVWQIESSVNFDERNGGLANRNSFVGISSGDMGTFVMGNHDTPYKMATRKMDVFADTIADNRNLMGGGFLTNQLSSTPGAVNFSPLAGITHDARGRNVIAYLTPNLSGFNGAFAYATNGFATETNDNTDATVLSLMGSYSAAGFTGSLAYQDVDNDADTIDSDAWKLGLGYSAMGFTGNFVYENVDAGSNIDVDSYYLGLKYAFTKADAIKFAYTDSEIDMNGPTTDADQWSLGYDHKLSKQTSVFALYTDAESDLGNTIALSNSPVTGNETDGFSFGLEHKF